MEWKKRKQLPSGHCTGMMGQGRGETALHVSARLNSNTQDNQGRTPLHVSVEQGYDTVAKLLLRHGADPNMIDSRHRLPLHYAAENGHLAACKLLLDFGSLVDVRDEAGHLPADLAGESGHEGCCFLILNRGMQLALGLNGEYDLIDDIADCEDLGLAPSGRRIVVSVPPEGGAEQAAGGGGDAASGAGGGAGAEDPAKRASKAALSSSQPGVSREAVERHAEWIRTLAAAEHEASERTRKCVRRGRGGEGGSAGSGEGEAGLPAQETGAASAGSVEAPAAMSGESRQSPELVAAGTSGGDREIEEGVEEKDKIAERPQGEFDWDGCLQEGGRWSELGEDEDCGVGLVDALLART